MKHLRALNKYFWKYRLRLGIGILFILVSNYFGVLVPQVTGFIIDHVQRTLQLSGYQPGSQRPAYGGLVESFIVWVENAEMGINKVVALAGITILALALLKGFFMFLMRQTIIVMSRHIEFDQKNEVYQHYQQLDSGFFKTHSTGDLMSRMAEDVSRVRQFTGPAVMYLINLVALISMSVYFMFRRDPTLTAYVLAPLPILAVTIYLVNTIINRRSERIQSMLAGLTTSAQESYSGIRVIKSFVQEKAMMGFFTKNSSEYRDNAIGLAKVEALYFPSMTLLIGLSTLLTIMIGGIYYYQGRIGLDVIVEFVIYINMLTFPVSAIGWTASMIQRAAASQKRLNEFLHTKPLVSSPAAAKTITLEGNISFKNVNFTYSHTGIQALRDFTLELKAGEKVAIVGRTGSGKSTVAQLLLRMYDVSRGKISIEGIDIKELDLESLRSQVSYVPQDVFLFSDTVENNIRFADESISSDEVRAAARRAGIHREIEQFSEGYQTMVGERGVTLSGGQKQRVSIARALVRDPRLVIFDDCLSAVDARTEKEVIGNLYEYLNNRTAIIITHRIFTLFHFDKIIVLEDGAIVEQGTHQQLIGADGPYAKLWQRQQREEGGT